MASKDQMIGGVILFVAVAIAIFYIWWVFLSFLYPPADYWYLGNWDFQSLAIVIPVFLIVIGILLIAAWIGFTMATTPPPKPLEEMPELSESKETPPPEQKAP